MKCQRKQSIGSEEETMEKATETSYTEARSPWLSRQHGVQASAKVNVAYTSRIAAQPAGVANLNQAVESTNA
jgi:hypothetical protein